MARLPKALRQGIRLLDVHTHSGISPFLYLTHAFPYCQGLRDAQEQNVRAGVTHAVVFPLCETLGYHLPSLARGKVRLGGGIGNAPFEFENTHLLRQIYEMFPQSRAMFIPFVMADALRETRNQVRILEKLIGTWPFYGIKIHPRATQARMAALGREGRPILEFARAHDLPFLIHAAWPGSADPLSNLNDLFVLARAHPKLRFCGAHFASFHLPTFEEAGRLDNVWIDSAAMVIGCECVRLKNGVYESGPRKIPADYRDPPAVFAAIARRFPDTFMWGSDNPFHTWVSAQRLANGRWIRCRLWSSLEQEVHLLRDVKGALRRKMAFENALRFLEG
ncbi:MAG: amidohydrolase family protein [Verrucomicrobiae bacterium]|nr:amidohydrolase family protein [Verrucomicrobiae bacterium]